MKALTIPASRPSMRERMRSGIKIGSATVSSLRRNFAEFRGFFAEFPQKFHGKLAQSGFFSELCSATHYDSVSVPRSSGHCSIHTGLFLCPGFSGAYGSTYSSQSTRLPSDNSCSRTGTASYCVATDGGRACFCPDASTKGNRATPSFAHATQYDAMKALQIQPSARLSSRAALRRMCAAVSNLQSRIDGNFTDFRGFFAEKLAQSGFFSELCSATTNDSLSVPRSIGHCSIHTGHFLCPDIIGADGSTYSSQSTRLPSESFLLPGDRTASLVVATDGGRACFCPDASTKGDRATPSFAYATTNDAMKALQIQPTARISGRAPLRRLCAAVSNLRSRIDARACLTVATAATVAFFFALGMMHVPGIIASGLTSLTCAALAPVDQKGGTL